MSSASIALSDLQERMAAWAESRRTPTGIIIPKEAEAISLVTSPPVVAPPYGASHQVTLLTFQVKAGYYALFYGLVAGWQGAGTPPLPGDVLFTVDVDRPLLSTNEGYIIRDFNAVPNSLGSFANGPVWPVEFRIRDQETIRVKGSTVANVGVGGRNFLVAAMVGFDWPERGMEGY